MKYLVGIPMLTGAEHCQRSLECVAHRGDEVGVLVIDNGAHQDVKEMLQQYCGIRNFNVISNQENVFVNRAWDQILEYFLQHKEYDYLLIMNSDLVLNRNWEKVLNLYFENYPQIIPIPVIEDAYIEDVPVDLIIKHHEVYEGTPGVLIILNRKHAEIVYPLPKEIKCWFGDNFIYEVLRGLGFKTVVPHNLLVRHAWSSTISRVAGITEIIEEDRKAWEKIKGCVDLRILEWES